MMSDTVQYGHNTTKKEAIRSANPADLRPIITNQDGEVDSNMVEKTINKIFEMAPDQNASRAYSLAWVLKQYTPDNLEGYIAQSLGDGEPYLLAACLDQSKRFDLIRPSSVQYVLSHLEQFQHPETSNEYNRLLASLGVVLGRCLDNVSQLHC